MFGDVAFAAQNSVVETIAKIATITTLNYDFNIGILCHHFVIVNALIRFRNPPTLPCAA
jgi:hypothetical protein